MSVWNNWSIRRKLFAIIVLLLALNVALLVFAGSWLFEQFYTSRRIKELKTSAERICDAYRVGGENFYSEISSMEFENVVVSLLAFEEGGALTTIYHSRGGRPDMDRRDQPPFPDWDNAPVEYYISDELAERIRRADESFEITRPQPTRSLILKPMQDAQNAPEQEKNAAKPAKTPKSVEMTRVVQLDMNDKFHDEVITLSTRIDDNLYLYVVTPRGYIQSMAEQAVQYTGILSVMILAIGSAFIYLLTGRVTRPIQDIQEVAEEISRLNFTHKCVVRGGDEIARLGAGVNSMSDSLQQSIEKLMAANEVLQSDLERQQQTDRMRRQFIANVSHDFKTPLTLMISYAEALEGGALSEEEQSYCEIIMAEGNKLSAMVGKMLSLSKLENKVEEITPSIFCLGEVLGGVLSNHKILLAQNDITLTRAIDEELIVRADYHRIEQAFSNYVENAAKYTPAGGWVRVRTQLEEGRCRVMVENSGPQIAPEALERLFESFYRADGSRTERDSYGLGLAIVRVILEAHNQEYGAENIDDGVRFWFTLEQADV